MYPPTPTEPVAQEGAATEPSRVLETKDAVLAFSDDVEDIPENVESLRGWLTVLGAFLAGFAYTTNYGVYQDFYVSEFLKNTTASSISWIGSLNTFLIISGGLVAGRLYDHGYFYYLLWGGSFLISLSLFMLSLCQPEHFYQVFLAQGVALGIGAGLVYVPSFAVVAQYFTKRRTLAMMIAAGGSSLGAVIHPIILNNLFHSSLGFGNSVRASASLVSVALLVACLLMRTKMPPSPQRMSYHKALAKFAKDVPFVFATLGMTLFSMGFYFPLFYLQLDANLQNLNKIFSFYSLVILQFGSFVGRMTTGLLTDRFGTDTITNFCVFVCSALIFAMIGIHSIASFAVFGFFYGFFSGSYLALTAPLVAILTEDESELGARMGLALAISGFGSLVGPPIDGALLTKDFIWWRAIVFSGGAAFLGFACLVIMQISHRRRLKPRRG